MELSARLLLFFSIACTSSGAGCVFCNVNLEIDASAGLRYVISTTAIASDGTLRFRFWLYTRLSSRAETSE